jgi:hypothetical protein
VRAGIFSKGLVYFQVILGRLVPSSVERRRSKFVLQAGKFHEEELVQIRKNRQEGRDGRS